MKVVVDTNVFVSGIFFTGPPHRILRAWRDGTIQLVVSVDLLAEYREVAGRLSKRYANVDIMPIVELVAVESHLVGATRLDEPVCDDPDDDMLLACALAGGTRTIISGDKHLLRVSGYRGIEVLRPNVFVKTYL